MVTHQVTSTTAGYLHALTTGDSSSQEMTNIRQSRTQRHSWEEKGSTTGELQIKVEVTKVNDRESF